LFSPDFTTDKPQYINNEKLMTKPRSDSFAEKISPKQRAQLIDWLSDHGYAETGELIAAPPPEGFGFQTSQATLSRFYKANFEEIEKSRQDKITDRALDHLEQDRREPGYRCVLADSSDLYLQERYHEALTRPLESIDDLKKLVFIAARLKELNIEFAPLARARQEQREEARAAALAQVPIMPNPGKVLSHEAVH
jgi:hypothetical protein